VPALKLTASPLTEFETTPPLKVALVVPSYDLLLATTFVIVTPKE